MMKKLFAFITIFALMICNSCKNNNNSILESTGVETNPNCTISYASYKNVNPIDDVSKYASEVATNLPVENGVIISPFYTLKINGEDVPLYATRTTNTIHSFAYIDIEKIDDSMSFSLDVQITLLKEAKTYNKYNPKVTVLPLKSNVKATIEDKQVTSNISSFGSFSYVFNNNQEEAITLIIKEKENTTELFKNKAISYIEPNDYSTSETSSQTYFTEPNKVYYFKSGTYLIDKISLPSNSILYFESGAYLKVIPTTNCSVLTNNGYENIIVAGRGLIDYSSCCGGEVPAGYHSNKGGLSFSHVNNISFSGVTVINSQTWTLCFTTCNDVYVSDVLLFGYRVFSDGIMLSDCQNGLVEHNFVRTGDDAIETKSTEGVQLTKNIYFKNNDVWTDKGVAYGCIYESKNDTSDVHFEDCTVGFAMGTWSNHLGCMVIQMGDRIGATISNITFNNIEVFHNYNDALMNLYIGGSGGRGPGSGIIKNIYFSNVSCHRNYGAYLNLRTYDSINCFIYTIYIDNVVANDILLTKDNYQTKGYVMDNVVGGYDYKYLRINTKVEGDENDE